MQLWTMADERPCALFELSHHPVDLLPRRGAHNGAGMVGDFAELRLRVAHGCRRWDQGSGTRMRMLRGDWGIVRPVVHGVHRQAARGEISAVGPCIEEPGLVDDSCMGDVGRNDPCPCGSGKKYKKCCALKVAAPAREAPEHALDRELVSKLFRFGRHRFGNHWDPFAEFPVPDMEADEVTAQLMAPWAVYEARFDGRRIVDLYLENAARITPAERSWLMRQQLTSLSVWEVASVEPGVGMDVVDLLTTEQCFAREVSGSNVLVARDVVLARIVHLDGYSVFCGMHPAPLPPRLAADVVKVVRSELGIKRKVTRVRLREEDAVDVMIQAWEAAADEHQRPKPIPKLCNTDGDPLLMTTDRYGLEPGTREEVLRRLASLESAVADHEPEGGEWHVHFERPGNPMNKAMDNTIVGHARVTDTALRLETNSIRRADALRTRVETACGWLIAHQSREHSDPQAMLERGVGQRRGKKKPREEQPPEMLEALRALKARHYETWLDIGLPALGGRTPREAAARPRMRPKLDVLLKEMENLESRLPEGERFDVRSLRARLGLRDEDGRSESAT